MTKKVDLNVRGNIKYISPEDVVSAYNGGFIAPTHHNFVKSVLENAETIQPVIFNAFRGLFDISIPTDSNVAITNAETELNDKVSALLQFYGDEIRHLSNSEIVNMLNTVLKNSAVNSITYVEPYKMISVILEDGQISPNGVVWGEDELVLELEI